MVVGRPVNQSHDRSVVLDQGTRDSGGRYDTILAGTALTARLKEVARELKSQYRVTYARPQTLIPPERVTVAAAKPDLTARGTVAHERSRDSTAMRLGIAFAALASCAGPRAFGARPSRLRPRRSDPASSSSR